jgi:oligo-alginate lyase
MMALVLPGISLGASATPQSASSASTRESSAPLFAAEIERSKSFIADMMREGVSVPVPKDAGGGYSHEQHKRNYRAIYEAGRLFRLTGERIYADFVRDVLLAYAELYPGLGPHPARSNQGYGRLFWQNLNDAVWLVNAIQGYADIRSELETAERRRIDTDVFRAAARFLSEESVATFDRIHNHATWSTAGVGMTGYVLGDGDLVRRALHGSKLDGSAGFLRQMDMLFSPDGYYTEGPYYQRYALLPFMLFADAVERNEPKRRIFDRRDGILLKALYTTIQLSYANHFFAFNDAIKDKTLNTEELYRAVAIGYEQTRDPALLSIAEQQNRVSLSDAGRRVAIDVARGQSTSFPFRTLLLADGPEGRDGAVAVLRKGDSQRGQTLVAKNTSQGMGHGHFDKLSWQFFDNGAEILTDYGAARFLNIEAKNGGRYLPENDTWAKQTLAHNTLVVDGVSHFRGDEYSADEHSPRQLAFGNAPDLSFSVAQIEGAYEDVTFTRTLAMVEIDPLSLPVVADIMRIHSRESHRYDLPLHYQGHLMRVGPSLKSHTATRPVLGTDNGYQHVWVDAEALPTAKDAFLTWRLNNRFYTWRWVPQPGSQLILGEVGANDPSFNLRREPLLIQRLTAADNAVFAGILEPHGNYDPQLEQTVFGDSQILSVSLERRTGADVLIVQTLSGSRVAVATAHDPDASLAHEIIVGDDKIRWKGAVGRIVLRSVGRSPG